MERYAKILDVAEYGKSSKCYLDGRYFNLVLQDVIPDRLSCPISLYIYTNEDGDVTSDIEHLPHSFPKNTLVFLRVIVRTEHISHSSLLLIDTMKGGYNDLRARGLKSLYNNATACDDRTSRGTCKAWLWDALTESMLDDSEVRKMLSTIKEQVGCCLYKIFKHKIDVEHTYDLVQERVPASCEHDAFGYCNAYALMKAISVIEGTEFDECRIMNFITAVEESYGDELDDLSPPDVEYRIGFGGAGLGLGLGLLGGVALGSALAAPRPAYYAAPVYPAYGYPAYGYGYPAYYV